MKFWNIIGWIFVPFIMIFIKWNTLKKTGRILGIIWSVILVFNIFNPNNEEAKQVITSTNEEVKEVDTPKGNNSEQSSTTELTVQTEDTQIEVVENEEKISETHKQAVLDFETKVYDLEGSISTYTEQYSKAMTGLGEGTVDIFTAYEATKNAKNAAEHLQLEFSKIEVSKDLPKEVKEKLNDAKSDLSTAYYTKKKAYNLVLEFLDEQKPSLVSEFQEELNMSDSFIMSGVLKIFEAKELVGIDLTSE